MRAVKRQTTEGCELEVWYRLAELAASLTSGFRQKPVLELHFLQMFDSTAYSWRSASSHHDLSIQRSQRLRNIAPAETSGNDGGEAASKRKQLSRRQFWRAYTTETP